MKSKIKLNKSQVDTLKRLIFNNGVDYQCIIATEELSELIKEVTKMIRSEGNIDNLVEEIADVFIVVSQLILMFDIDCRKIDKVIDFKIGRLKTKLDKVAT